MYDDNGPKVLEALGELGSIDEFDPDAYLASQEDDLDLLADTTDDDTTTTDDDGVDPF